MSGPYLTAGLGALQHSDGVRPVLWEGKADKALAAMSRAGCAGECYPLQM